MIPVLLKPILTRDPALIERFRLEDDEAGGRIRCPQCRWQPKPASLWFCADSLHPEGFLGGCGTAWNTFDTRGRCPGCGHQWRWTSCLQCGGWSPHDDWYADEEE